MKILYGITKSNMGGAQRYVLDLATEAKKAGHDVAVLCGGEGALVHKLKEEGIRVIGIKRMQRDISLIDELHSFYFILRTLIAEKPDVFHTNSSKMGGLGNLAARLAGIKKIIFTAHGWAFNESWRPVWQKAVIKVGYWPMIALSHKTICVSKKTLEQIDAWPFIKNKLVVIYICIKPFDLMRREGNGFVVGCIAELHKIKGLDVLLLAWAEFIKKHREAKLVIMGEGEEHKELKTLAQELSISNSVSFAGQVDNARAHLLDFDIFVLPSRSENLPYVILEAGLAKLPVIASRVGGILEVIETGLSGILVEPENYQEIFSSLLLLADDKVLRDRLGEALYNTVSTKFSLDKMSQETFKLYSSH
ncbi:glycosyltransferase family 4 protein [Candidatus Parcubacteria bacterium]|nr:glycosyltransferase family 4 protein [Candidatus Parcubacteria bacterium]